MECGTVEWSNLPKDLLRMVAKLLDSRTDILRLRAVCSSWRSSLRPSLKKSPLFSVKFPFPICPNDALNPKRQGYFTLTEHTMHYLEPCSDNPNRKGWMVKLEEWEPGKMRILEPFSRFTFRDSPEVSPKIVDLLNLRLSEVSKIHDLQFVEDNLVMEVKFNELESIWVKKVIMSPIPAWIDDISSDHAILTIHTGGKLGYFKLGDKTWSTIDDGKDDSLYDDIAYYKGKFWAVDMRGQVIVIDSSLNVGIIESPMPHYAGGQDKYLVDDGANLYLVHKYLTDQEMFYDEEIEAYATKKTDCTIHFRFYKLNDDNKEWVQVSSLGDQALFIGDNCCFSVLARRFSACKKNSIYFTDMSFSEEVDNHPGYDVGMFDLENYTTGHISHYKGYSQLFWPPPTWLKPKSSPKPSSSRR